ncbi:hypothetical protein CP972_23370 [Streptomyces prasinus]|uniref:Uncharacterized protein n=1 Tax=Streptomyces prasinus TaxID=67345 RepID=A0ABX6B227_9ACTN|nr:hypothetical protein CP972_23370 [Streptomyces prasinus]
MPEPPPGALLPAPDLRGANQSLVGLSAGADCCGTDCCGAVRGAPGAVAAEGSTAPAPEPGPDPVPVPAPRARGERGAGACALAPL